MAMMIIVVKKKILQAFKKKVLNKKQVFFLHRNKHFNNVHKRFSNQLNNKLTRVSNERFVVTKLLKSVHQLQQLNTEIVFERTLTKHNVIVYFSIFYCRLNTFLK